MHTKSHLRPLATAIAAGAIALSVAIAAQGSGFALLEQSASRLGTAFSGTAAAADDATTIFYNPAGLVDFGKREVAVVASGVEISSQFKNSNSQPALGQPLGDAGSDAGGWNAIPAMYLSVPVNDDLVFGLAFNVPFGLKLEYDDDWIGRFQALKSEIKTYNLNPAVSFRLNEHVLLGFGVSYQRVEAELTNAVNYTAVVAQGLQQLAAAGQIPATAVPGLIAANAGLQGDTIVSGDDSQWGFNGGVLFKFSDDTKLGIAYRSSLDYHVEGEVKFTAPTAADATGAAIIAAATAPGGRLSTGPVSVDLELPDIATASFYQRLGRIELLADVAWTGWSSVQELRIVRDSGVVLSVTPELWEDTWRYAVGATYELNEAVKLRGGVAFDNTPVPAATRTARLPDAERTWVAIGAQWDPGAMGSLIIDFGYARLVSDDVAINQNSGSTEAFGLLNGEQQSGVNIVSVQVGYQF